MTSRGTVEGTPCWAELATPDPERAAAFYAAVLGWAVDAEGLARHDDRPVARLHAAVDGVAVWTLYFAVDDADDACERLAELGGSVLHEPEDADGHPAARCFLALDPGGAEFGGWESDAAVGATLVGADAASGEPGPSRTFYAAMFGYRVEPAGDTATIVGADGAVVGTLGIAGHALPHWRPRFAVADLTAALDAVTAAGGTPVDRDAGTALVRDDAGASLVLVGR